MKLSTRMYGALTAVMTAALLMSAASFYSERTLTSKLDTAIRSTTRKVELVNATRSKVWEAEAQKRGAFLAITLGDSALAQKFAAQWRTSAQDLDKQVQELRLLMPRGAGADDVRQIQEAQSQYAPLVQEFLNIIGSGRPQEVAPLVPRIMALVDKFDYAGQSLIEQQRRELAESKNEAEAVAARTTWVMSTFLCLILVSGLFALFVVRSTIQTLVKSITALREGSELVSSAANQTSASSQVLSQASCQQAACLEETSASAHEISSMTSSNAEHARAASACAEETATRVAAAGEYVQELETSMNNIVRSSTEISRIIKVIDEIAFQTNILALNAAVEAARAGDAGSGFAVVADEVRALAQRSADAAKDTNALIEQAVGETKQGRSRLEKVSSAVAAIIGDAQRVRALAEQVQSSSAEQSRGITEISRAIQDMEAGTQTVALNAEQAAKAGEELAVQANAVSSTVSDLSVLVYGATRGKA